MNQVPAPAPSTPPPLAGAGGRQAGWGPPRGFTLLEVLIAAAIGVALLALMAQAYFAANKAKAVTVGTSLLKVSGAHAVAEIYKNLHQSRHLFGRGHLADTILQRMPMAPYYSGPDAVSPGMVPEDVRLADVRLKGSFWIKDAAGELNPDFDPDAVGNALLFATTEPKVVINDPPGQPVQRTVFGSSQVQFAAVRLHFYFLARRVLPTRLGAIRGADRYLYQLMHLRSVPYVDYREVVDWLRQIKATGGAGSEAYVGARLAELATVVPGAIALDAADAGTALYSLSAAPGATDLRVDGESRWREGNYVTPLTFTMTDNFGVPMVAFNTTSQATPPSPGQPTVPPAVPVARLDVPAYARDDAPQPYGLEVMIGGPPDRRQVLVRLSLAARTQPGNVMVGETFQQVVQVYDF